MRDAADGSSLRVHGTRIERNGFKGIKVDASGSVSVRDSTIADNGDEGVTVSAGAGENVVVDVVRALVGATAQPASGSRRTAQTRSRRRR